MRITVTEKNRLFIHKGQRWSNFWCYPSLITKFDGRDACSFVCVTGLPALEFGPPPSETLRTLIRCGAPWYVVLDRFVEEYPQWEEVLAWAPQTQTEGV